jgi:hypothetical protein
MRDSIDDGFSAFDRMMDVTLHLDIMHYRNSITSIYKGRIISLTVEAVSGSQVSLFILMPRHAIEKLLVPSSHEFTLKSPIIITSVTGQKPLFTPGYVRQS